MLIVFLIGALSILYILVKRHYSHWNRFGFASDEAVIPYGSLAKVFRKERPFGLVIADLYERFQDKAVGIYMFFKPVILLRDAALVRQILTSDFGNFHDRGLYVDEKNDPMSANLFTLEGQSWRNLRAKLTPSFSSGKLKGMFETVDEVGDKLINYLLEQLKDGKSHTLEIKSILTTYAVDIIGSVIFGLNIDSFTTPDNEFRVLSDRAFNIKKSPAWQRLRGMMSFICPPILYILLKRHYSHWERLGFVSDEAVIPYGSLLKVFRKERPFGLITADLYECFQDKAVGIYMFFKPAILLRDAALVRQILTSDFGSFHDRGLYIDEKNDPMSANIFTLEGQSWRNLRTKLTPSFSSGKLKEMFETVDEVGDKLINYLSEQLKDGKSYTLEIKNILTTYTVDIIGSVIFGLDIDSFTNPDNEFRVLSDRLLSDRKSPAWQRLRNLMNFICPPAASLLARLGVRDPVTYRLRDIVKRTIEFREEKGVMRKDLLQLLIQLRNTGKISDDNDEVWKAESAAENLKAMSIDMIASNSFLFYIAGSETTAATTAFTIYEFAMNSEILKKAQTEVDQCLEKHGLKPGGSLTYEVIQDMKYLDLCVMETTRKYPGLPFLNRQCTQDFPIPDTDLTIRKGTGIIISLLGIHRDAEYFPNPMDYKPERFAEDTMDYNPVAFMPFGVGPRHCIAQRMGIVNVKVALVKILANFNIEPMPRQEVEFKFHTAPVLVSKNGLRVGLSKRW